MIHLKYVIAISFAVMSLVAFCAFGIDKYKARHDRWRIPESTLLLIALFGGAVGAYLGMKAFHHKTMHKKFTIAVSLLALIHIAVIFWSFGWIQI